MTGGVEGDVPARFAAAVEFVVGRVRADFGALAVVNVRLDPGWAGPSGDGAEDLIASVFDGRHEFPLGLEDGVEYACWNLAGQVQDDVVGELGRPWPELLDIDGATRGVLEPAPTDGLATWALRGRPFCAVGQLTAAVRAAGLTLR